jgi:hypothetical protein
MRAVVIGPIRYAVRRVRRLFADDGTKLLGQIDYTACRIDLEAQAHPQTQRATLIHEILHGILTNAGERDHDERLIDLLSYGLLDVLTANPELVAYLTETR